MKNNNRDRRITDYGTFSALIGELDEDIDKRLDFANIKAEPLGPIWVL